MFRPNHQWVRGPTSIEGLGQKSIPSRRALARNAEVFGPLKMVLHLGPQEINSTDPQRIVDYPVLDDGAASRRNHARRRDTRTRGAYRAAAMRRPS